MEPSNHNDQIKNAHKLAVELCQDVPESAFIAVYHSLMARLIGFPNSLSYSNNMTATGVRSYLSARALNPDLAKDLEGAFRVE